MAFREAVVAEPLDLPEAALGELPVVSPPHHPIHELVAEAMDGAVVAKAGHGPAQLVGFGRAESGPDDGDLHRLLLEEGHAQCLPQHLAQLFGGILHRLDAPSPAQVGVDHVPLDGPRTHDRHFDDQVVEGGRLQPGEHRHLRPALDLEHADRVRPLDHPVHPRILRGHVPQGVADAVVRLQQLEGTPDAGEHAEPQHVHLDEPQRLEIVLVPLDHRAVVHGRVLDGNDLAQRPAGDDEPARVLGQMAGEAVQFPGQLQGQAQAPVRRIESLLAGALLVHRLRPHRSHGEQPVDRVLAQPHGPAGVAQGAAHAVGHHRRGQPGPFPAVLAVDVLDDLLAALVLEVHVDVGHFAPLGGDEALEQQVDAVRIDRSDLQAVAHRRVGGRAAPLAQDAQAAGGPDNVGDGEEVRGELQFTDERQLVFEGRPHPGGDALGIAPGRALPGHNLQLPLGCAAFTHHLLGVFVAQLFEREAAAFGDLHRIGQGTGMIAKEGNHLRGGLEMAFRVGREAPAGGVDGAALADAGEQIVEPAPLGDVLVHVAGRDQRHALRLREGCESGQAADVVAPVAAGGGQVERCVQPLSVPRQPVGETGTGHFRRQGNEDLLPGRFHDILAHEPTLPLGCAPASAGDQAGQTAVALPGDGQAEQGRPVLEVEAGAGNEAQLRLAGGVVGAHDPRQGVAVGERQGAVAQRMRPLHKLLGLGGAAQEREVAGDLEFRVAARPGRRASVYAAAGEARRGVAPGPVHAKNPCRNHRGGAAGSRDRSQKSQ